MQGWGVSCRGGVGCTGVGWGGVGHVRVGVSYMGGVGWVMQGWGGLGHGRVG